MNLEVEAAFERLLATVPVETHAVLKTCRVALGVFQLAAESAARRGVEVALPTTAGMDDSDRAGLQFTLLGFTHTIDADHVLSGGDTWKMDWRCPHGRNVAYEGITFETEAVYMHGQDMTIPVYGYLTKAAAVEALGRLAATLWDRLETPPKSGAT